MGQFEKSRIFEIRRVAARKSWRFSSLSGIRPIKKKEITDAAYVQAQRVIRHLFFSLHASLLTHKVPAPQLSVCETST